MIAHALEENIYGHTIKDNHKKYIKNTEWHNTQTELPDKEGTKNVTKKYKCLTGGEKNKAVGLAYINVKR